VERHYIRGWAHDQTLREAASGKQGAETELRSNSTPARHRAGRCRAAAGRRQSDSLAGAAKNCSGRPGPEAQLTPRLLQEP